MGQSVEHFMMAVGGREFQGFSSVKTLKTKEFVHFKHVFSCNLKKLEILSFAKIERFCKKTIRIAPYYNLSGTNHQI